LQYEYLKPINVIVFNGNKNCLKINFLLRCFQQLFFINLATQRCFLLTTDTPEVYLTWSSRTKV